MSPASLCWRCAHHAQVLREPVLSEGTDEARESVGQVPVRSFRKAALFFSLFISNAGNVFLMSNSNFEILRRLLLESCLKYKWRNLHPASTPLFLCFSFSEPLSFLPPLCLFSAEQVGFSLLNWLGICGRGVRFDEKFTEAIPGEFYFCFQNRCPLLCVSAHRQGDQHRWGGAGHVGQN